ncbi:type II toxin-antitoxin system RelE/ParE family toxin [Candidatus Poribacteria bacterium]|nr:type II toxin-antitoxin system RelE/ParE family toxin [Candidatus Poribacteria bacterium]
MAKTVVFSKRSRNRLEKLLAYLENEWSLKVKSEFIEKLDRCVLQISKHPESCPVSEEFPGLYKFVVTKQTTLYYRIEEKEIQVITFFDNRQDPKKLKP